MNRPIKFRAWDSYHKRMRTDVLVSTDKETTTVFLRFPKLEEWPWKKDDHGVYNSTGEVIPMQFTGLKDKNGKDIYEGDILRVFYEGRPAVGKVIYTGDRFIVTLPEDTQKPYFLCLYAHNRIPLFKWSESEVIGDIHTTPNLLTNSDK